MERRWQPFFGVHGGGSSPAEWGTISTKEPRAHGGNLDNKEAGEGATLFLPVVGRSRARIFPQAMGMACRATGEVCINALEICLTGTFTLTLHKNTAQPSSPGGTRPPLLAYPRAETATHFISMGMHEDLDVAMKGALRRDDRLHLLPLQPVAQRGVSILLAGGGFLHVTQTVNVARRACTGC